MGKWDLKSRIEFTTGRAAVNTNTAKAKSQAELVTEMMKNLELLLKSAWIKLRW